LKSNHNKKSQSLVIVYLTLATLPGRKANSIQTVRMCDSLARKGCQVYLLAPAKFERLHVLNTFQKLKEFYNIKSSFKVIPIIPPIFWTKNKKVNAIVHLLASAFYAFLCSIFIDFIKILTRRRIFLFIRTPLLLALLQALRPLNRGVKIIYECHNIDYKISTQSKLKPLFVRGLREASQIISISRSLSNQLKKVVRLKRPIIILHDAYDELLFRGLTEASRDLKMKLGLPQDKWIVAYVGQLWSWKKPEFIIDAFRFIEDDDIVLLFVGGSEQDIRRLREYARQMKVRNVIFKGFVKPAIVPKFLKAADCLVHYTPSRGLLKSYSPLKIFEYMAAGKPILAPRQPWIEEVLKDGENALLFDENSPRDLAEKIKLLRRDRELAERISRNAKLESSKYTYEKRAERLIEVLMKL